MPPGRDADASLRAAYVAARQAEADASYHLEAVSTSGSYTATNAAAHLVARFEAGAVHLSPAAEAAQTDVDAEPEVELRLARLGYASELAPVASARTRSVAANRIELERGTVVEWYLNGPLGLQQGFDVEAPPAQGSGELVLEIAVEGAHVRATAETDAVMLDRGDGRARLRYGELVVLDADGRGVSAHLSQTEGAIQIRIDDRDARYPLVVDPLVVVSETRLLPRNYGSDSTQMGRSVDVDGDLAVVGAPGFWNGAFVGAAYIFRRAGQRWSQEAVVTPGVASSNFALSVAIRGETVAVGAYSEDASFGATYIYTKVGLDWVEQKRLIPPDPAPATTPRFGYALDLTDGELLVSAPGEGAAYLFAGADANWTYTEKFAATGSATNNGPVAIDGDVAVVWRNVFERDGSSWYPAQTLPAIGSEEPASVDVEGDTIALGFGLSSYIVHVYAKQGSQWAFDAPLTPQTSADTHDFGFSVSVEGDLIAVGARRADFARFDSGGAFVFARGAGQWTQIAALGAPDGAQSDQMGQSIALSGGTLFVGSWAADSPEGLNNAGAAYVSERQGTGFSPLVRVTPALDGSDPNASIGSSVAMDVDTIVLGAYRSSLQFTRSGAGYVFVRHPGSIWEQQGVLLASDAWPLQQLGESAAVNADTAILGAPDYRSPGTEPGAAYVFKRSGTVWSQEQKLLHDDPAAYDYFGDAVAVDGDTAAIGSPGKDGATGAVYVFKRSGTVWSQEQKLVASDAETISRFGDSVALEGDTMVVGSPRADQAPQGGFSGEDFGGMYVFTRSGTVWTEQVRLNGWQLPSMLGLGDDVDIDGDVIAGVGYGRYANVFVQPTAYLYQGSGATWQQLARVQPTSGRSIAIDGDLLVVDDYVYAPTNVARTAWQLQTTLTPSDTEGIGVFTNDVAAQGSTAVITRGINVAADIQGAGFVFELADALADGSGCTSAGQCTSGYCVDGVCCDQPCDGECQSCLEYAKADASPDGTCSQAATGVPCGPSGGCASSSEHELAPTCDAAGVCQPNVFTCQDGFACLGDSVTGRCVTTCTVNAQPDHSRCADDHYCDAGNCLPDKGVGGSCSIDEECLSGTCTNSVCLGEYGDPCDVTACAEGACVDGYCCEETCNGKCEACGEPGFEGKCVEVTGPPRGGRTPCIAHPDCGGTCNGQDRNACAYPGNATACGTDSCVDGELTLNHCDGAGACAADAPASCSPYSDCADAQSCLSSCTGDAQCVNNHFCDDTTNTCLPDRMGGATCSRNAQCQTGNCADGVCCNTACDKRCEACAESGQEGTCVAVVGMPRGSRAACAGAGTPCEGACDGGTRDACSYPAGTSCGTSTCTNAVAYGALCDQGACVTNTSGQSCFPYTSCADGTQCLSTCLSQSQCAAGYFCDSARSPAQCVQQQADGAACDTAAQCLSGFCADGVCCNTECTSQCEACAESGSEGMCVTVTGAPRGARAACAGTDDPDNVCAGACGGSRDKCSYPAAGSPCEDAACDGAVLTPARVCDGAGACGLASTQDCGAYGCDAAQSRCNSRCDSRGDCAAGALCRLDVRECAFVPSVCIDAFTVELADGTQASCDGHRCSAGDCQERCADDTDCASGYLCFERDCVPESDVPVDAGTGAQDAGRDAAPTTESDAATAAPDAGNAAPTADVEPDAGVADDGGRGDDSGCGCRVPGTRRGPAPYPLLALGVVLALGRRKRRRR